MVESRGAADKHLFRVATPQRAGATERPEVDDRHAPTGGAHAHRGDHGRCAGSYDYKVVLVKSEEHTSELQSLLRSSYAVFCLKKKNRKPYQTRNQQHKL